MVLEAVDLPCEVGLHVLWLEGEQRLGFLPLLKKADAFGCILLSNKWSVFILYGSGVLFVVFFFAVQNSHVQVVQYLR